MPKIFLFIILIAIFGALVYAGVSVIQQSDRMYEASKAFSDRTFDKVPVAPSYGTIKEGYAQALLYFTLATGVCLLALMSDRLTNISLSPLGGINLVLKDITSQVKSIVQLSNEQQRASIGEGGAVSQSRIEHLKTSNLAIDRIGVIEKNESIDDTQKGKWSCYTKWTNAHSRCKISRKWVF